MAGLPSVPDDYEEGGDRDENTDGSDPGDIQGADGVDELRHQGGEPQAIIHAEDGGRAIVGRVLQASRSVIGRVMGVDPGVGQDQAALDQAGQQGPVEDGVEFESADDATSETKSLQGDEGVDGVHASNVSATAVFGDHDREERPPSAVAIDTAAAHDEETTETGIIANFDAAIAAGDMASARGMFLEVFEAMAQLSRALDVVNAEKTTVEATVVELENEIVEKEGAVLALSQDLSAKDQVCKELHERIEAERRVAAENILTAAEMTGIDAVFAELPPNGGSVTKFAKAAGDYITTRTNRRRTIALSGVQGNVDWVSAGEAITAFGENTERLVPGRAANDNKFMEVMETLSKATDMLEESGFDSTVSSMPARAEKDPSAKTKAIADAAGKVIFKTPSEFDEEELLRRICATAESTALGHLVPVFRCAAITQSIRLYTSLVREERLRRKHDNKESKALEEVVAQDQTYIAEMVKIICGTAAPSLKESNGYSRERLLGAAGARQLPMCGFALAALAVRELDQADATASSVSIRRLMNFGAAHAGRFGGCTEKWLHQLADMMDVHVKKFGEITSLSLYHAIVIPILVKDATESLKSWRMRSAYKDQFLEISMSYEQVKPMVKAMLADLFKYQQHNFHALYRRVILSAAEYAKAKPGAPDAVSLFATGDVQDPCPKCGHRHPANGACLQLENLQRLVDKGEALTRMLSAPVDKVKASVKQLASAGGSPDAVRQLQAAAAEITKTVKLMAEVRDLHKSKLSRAAKALIAKETPTAPADAPKPAEATKNEATLLTKVHDQLSKILANKTAADGTTNLSPPAAAAKALAAKLAAYGLPPNTCRKFVTQGHECTGHCRFLHPTGKENIIPAAPKCAREGCSKTCPPLTVVGDTTRYHQWCSQECAGAARGARSGRSKNVPAANVVTDTMLEELFTAAIGDSNVDAAGQKPMAAVAISHELTLKALPRALVGKLHDTVDAKLKQAMEVSDVTCFSGGVLKDQIISDSGGILTYFHDGVSNDQLVSCSTGVLWRSTIMSRPAAVSAQMRWASGEYVTHNDRGEMMLDLYLQRACCAFMQPADFAHEFGHYDPALACRVTGCLLEYYDDVELDSLSPLQFYTSCDELIRAIRHLQFQAVSDAFRVDTLDRAAAVSQQYLTFTLHSWPRPEYVDGRAQAADGHCMFAQFLESRDISPTFVEPRDFYTNEGIEMWTERSGSVQGVSRADVYSPSYMDDANSLEVTCEKFDFLQGDSPERMRNGLGRQNSSALRRSASGGNGGNDVGDTDCEHAYRDDDGEDADDEAGDCEHEDADDEAGDCEHEDADDEAGDCEHESADELDLSRPSDDDDADYEIESVNSGGDLDSLPGLVHSSDEEVSDSDDADDDEIEDPDEDGFKHDRSTDEDDEDSDDLPGLIASSSDDEDPPPLDRRPNGPERSSTSQPVQPGGCRDELASDLCFPARLDIDETQRQRLVHLMSVTTPLHSARIPGIILWLCDSGSTCLLSPHREHVVLELPCTATISGVGSMQSSSLSPAVLTTMDSDGQYVTLQCERCYNLPEVGFAILSTGLFEAAGYQWNMAGKDSTMVTPSGCVVPLIYDDETGFHYIVEHTLAAPTLELKNAIIQKAMASDTSLMLSTPALFQETPEIKPDACHDLSSLRALSRSALGGESALVATRSSKTKRASVIERIDGRVAHAEKSSDTKMKAWYMSLPKRPHACSKVPGCKCSLCDKYFYLADGEWDEVTASRYVSLREEKIPVTIIDRNALNKSRDVLVGQTLSYQFDNHQGGSKGLVFQHLDTDQHSDVYALAFQRKGEDDWVELVPFDEVLKLIPSSWAKKGAPSPAAQTRIEAARLSAVAKGIVPPVMSSNIKQATPSAASGCDMKSDDTYASKLRRASDNERLKKRTPPMLKVPVVKLENSKEPREIADMRKMVHRLLGHVSEDKIFKAAKYIEGAEDILELMTFGKKGRQHCDTCATMKSRMPSLPNGRTARPERIAHVKKVYVDLTGYITEKSIYHGYHYAMAGVTDKCFAVLIGLAFKSQALLGMARIFADLNGVPDQITIDGEGSLNTDPALAWMTGKGDERKSKVTVTEPYSAFRLGMIERRWGKWKAIARCLMEEANIDIPWWYYAMRMAVMITNVTDLERDDEGNELPRTAYEAHFGEKPDMKRLLLGPFGCAAWLILSEEQRQARGLSSSFGMRALHGVYLGPNLCPRTGVYNHMMTDGKNIFQTPHCMKVVEDLFPCKVDGRSYSGDAAVSGEVVTLCTDDVNDGGGTELEIRECYRQAFVVASTEATRFDREFALAMKTRFDGQQRIKGSKKTRATAIAPDRPFESPEHSRRHYDKAMREGKDPNVEVCFETPADYHVTPMIRDHVELQPYPGAKYEILVPPDHMDETIVPVGDAHPHRRFVGRRIRKTFDDVGDKNASAAARTFEGTVESYMEKRQLFKVKYDDGDAEELDFQQMFEVLVMSARFGDDVGDENVTRAEKLEKMRAAALQAEVEAQLSTRYAEKVHTANDNWRPDKDEISLQAEDDVNGTGSFEVPVPQEDEEPIYDDEPNNMAELARHPERVAILRSAQLEMQQLVDMEVGVMLTEKEVQSVLREGHKILRSRMIYKRKYTKSPTTGREHFLKWKGRLAVDGSGQTPGLDTTWSTFSPTVGFTAIRTLVASLCNPAFQVESYDLSGAFLGTKLEDQAVYVKLPPDAGVYANRVLRLKKAVYGTKASGASFMRQLSEQVLKFKHKDSSSGEEYGFKKLLADQCIFKYSDAKGNTMVFLSYVDDIVFAHNNVKLRDEFFATLNEAWKVTQEGVLDRFLAVNFTRSSDGWEWKASMQGYIDKIVRRFDLVDSRTPSTPMEAGFTLVESDFDEEPTEEMRTLYRSLIGSIGYASTAVRFDIAHAVSVLSRHLAKPCKKVIDAAKRVVRYLHGTRTLSIKWRSSAVEVEKEVANILQGFVDSSFAMCALTRRSHAGWINFLNHGPVSWKSGLQPIVTLSSCESEYVALCGEVCEVKYLRSLLKELGYPQTDSTLIWEDNKAAILVAEQECSSAGRCKHIDVRFRFVAQAIKNREVRVRYTPTDVNVADLFTKALTPAVFDRLMGLVSGDATMPEEDASVEHYVGRSLFMLDEIELN